MIDVKAGKIFTTVSDIALCQRCPVLLAYKVHMKAKTAWSTGIKGTGEAYGSIFHKNIARVFFEAAANPKSFLYREIIRAVWAGHRSLDAFVREKIFLPFIESESHRLTSGQIMSMASGVRVWIRAMSEFFREIASLRYNPGEVIPKIFMKPEQELQAEYILPDKNILVVTGRYDALLFNPDKAEARLFEFKGYNKSDIVIPLSQSLVYSWLIERRTGITPSVEIIYLDERSRDPDVFDSGSVREMISSKLSNLFALVYNVISRKNFQAVGVTRTDKKLCSDCRFSGRCSYDIASGFRRRRRGMSLVNVLTFMLFSVLVMSQVFFYSVNSMESVSEERNIMRVRLLLDDMIRQARDVVRTNSGSIPGKGSGEIRYDHFMDAGTYYSMQHPSTVSGVDIHNLNYKFYSSIINKDYYNKHKVERIFDQMPGHYLIRAYAPVANGRNLMIQAVVSSQDVMKSWQEVWY